MYALALGFGLNCAVANSRLSQELGFANTLPFLAYWLLFTPAFSGVLAGGVPPPPPFFSFLFRINSSFFAHSDPARRFKSAVPTSKTCAC